MPVVGVPRDELFNRLGDNFGSIPGVLDQEVDDRFQLVCFSFGVELDEVTTDRAMKEKETGKVDESASNEIIYKFDVPANRYDLLCLEGIARSLSIFSGKEKLPNYYLTKPQQLQRMIIKKEVKEIRPFVVCAVLRGLTFNKSNYQSFIDLQERLHQNICRRRTLASIGTHDLDTIKGPFTYDALPPKEIKFAPLNNTTVMDGEQLMNHLDNDNHLKKYLHIIRNAPRYPVIYDSNGVVLSLPPIINGNHSKITLNTKNVFIEVTATDLTKAQITLNTVCAMFSEYCSQKFSVEPVELIEPDEKRIICPDLSTRTVETTVDYINKGIGANIEPEEIVKLLARMSLPAELYEDRKTLKVSIPCTRSDIFHPCDIMEDVAIAFGYNNLKIEFPPTNTHGKQQTLNKVTDLLRQEVALAGYYEALTLALCSRNENFAFLKRVDDGSAVSLANPMNEEYQVGRTTLLVGLLKTISANRSAPLPIRIFEISDIILKDNQTDVGARNQRNLCAINCNHTAGFEVVHALLDQVMLVNGIQWKEQGTEIKNGKHYYLQPTEDPTYFPGRRADIILNGKKVGTLGIIHPDVLKNFGIKFPCSALELNIEPFI